MLLGRKTPTNKQGQLSISAKAFITPQTLDGTVCVTIRGGQSANGPLSLCEAGRETITNMEKNVAPGFFLSY